VRVRGKDVNEYFQRIRNALSVYSFSLSSSAADISLQSTECHYSDSASDLDPEHAQDRLELKMLSTLQNSKEDRMRLSRENDETF
jgi:hypothetical protein